jgi:hypothetical protein
MSGDAADWVAAPIGGRRAIIKSPSRRGPHNSPRLRPGGQSDGANRVHSPSMYQAVASVLCIRR